MKQPTNRLSTRARVITTLERIQQGQSLASLLDPLLNQINDQDKGFAHELLLGTLRQWWALSRIGESLIDYEVTDKGVWAGLNVGLYQLLYMDTPDYAAIGETVEAIKELDKGYGAGLVNAILRKVQKNPTKFAKKIEKNHSLPNWLAKQLKHDWTEHYAALGQALRDTAPIFLRINPKFSTYSHYAKLLKEQGIGYELVNIGFKDEKAIRLTDHVRVTALPHFNEGWFSVQDLHAQLSGHILATACPSPRRVLDACAAPGGKTAQLLEMFHVEPLSKLVALDNDEKRLGRVTENLQRLQLLNSKVNLVCEDATQFKADVAQTVDLQRKILANCWQHLAPNGYLLYITCSLLKAENTQQIQTFLTQYPDAAAVDFELTLPNQIKQAVGYQCLPLDPNGGDGFFYALLQKKS